MRCCTCVVVDKICVDKSFFIHDCGYYGCTCICSPHGFPQIEILNFHIELSP